MYFPLYSCTDGAKDWAKAADTIVRCCLRERQKPLILKGFRMGIRENLITIH